LYSLSAFRPAARIFEAALKILITGSTGLIGSKLTALLTERGNRVLSMVRRNPSGNNEIQWNPAAGTLDKSALEGLDAVVHLAGENIASGRWTPARKKLIRMSRLQGTQLLAQSLAHLFDPPKVLISVSAIGYYGDRGEELLDENSSSGTGFLPELCREWEAATSPASMRNIRVVNPRLGVVLSGSGGALPRMLAPFRWGVGGRIGSGRQFMSWIAIEDLVGMIDHAIHCNSLQGPLNAVSPNPVTNSEFSKTIGKILKRPALFPVPAFTLRLAFGQMADEVLLAGARVSADRLLKSGYKFLYPELEDALRHILIKQ
jgi:uncharacterized protein (TIGR01777 family)